MIICPWKDIKKYAPLLPGIEEAFDAVNALDSLEPGTYPLSGGNRFLILSGKTIPVTEGYFEAHRDYLDIQYMVKGHEMLGWAPLETLDVAQEYSETYDFGFYSGPCDFSRIGEGICYVAFPEDAHMPGRHLDVPNDFVKIVVKLKVSL